MKRIVTMQDISCVGKCSLTAALPVLSAMGLETAVLPTAVLSSHTMFKHVSFCDLTDQIPAILHAWNEEHFTFSAIYTGYLGSAKQISYAMDLFDQFGKDALILVDPCMADHGKLYRGFSMDFVQQMKQLCRKASIICPNLTEACILTGTPYSGKLTDTDALLYICKKLVDMGGRLRLIAQDVTCEKPFQDMPNLPVARAMWRPEPSFFEGLECWIIAGGAHHTVLSYDVTAQALRDFTRIMGIELVVIDKDTTPVSLERDLKISDIIYGR